MGGSIQATLAGSLGDNGFSGASMIGLGSVCSAWSAVAAHFLYCTTQGCLHKCRGPEASPEFSHLENIPSDILAFAIVQKTKFS